ncbi:MAG: glycosyltransferase family 39 protein [Aridibacter sp.]
MSKSILQPITAGIRPELFADNNLLNTKTIIVVLAVCLLLGFGLRVWNLGAESLSEDELNKLQTVAEYRTNGLTGRNGEHPFLMKGLQILSITAAEIWNGYFAAPKISEEAALRFPTALFGTFTALLLFFLIKELFGSSIGLISAALWSLDPNAIGFDRIAKEDSFLLFFFLLANVFWIRSQTLAERGDKNRMNYVWLTAIAFGGMAASKYLIHLFAISIAYFETMSVVLPRKWYFGKARWIKFFLIMGVSFVILNPTILFPETWHQILTFSGEKRIGHDSYEFMGELYRNQMTLWFAGVPWTFYYIFILVKTPILTLLFFLSGLPMLFRRKMGDGRFFIFFWLFLWFFPFTVFGGKFTRYFTIAQPLIFIIAAIGCFYSSKWLAEKLFPDSALKNYFVWIIPFILVTASFINSISVAPYYRLHTNFSGGGKQSVGYYFPHDEFYDTSTREIAAEISKIAESRAVVATETPYLFEYYARKQGRNDLISVSLSDKTKVSELSTGDFIVAAKGRHYFSNDAYLNHLEKNVKPAFVIKIDGINSANTYKLDEESVRQIKDLAEQK